MAINRQNLFYSGQRLDIPQLRSIESGMQADSSTAWGSIFAGRKPLIMRGFTVGVTAATIGSAANTLQLNTASGQVNHFYASDAGAVLEVSSTQLPETLSATNATVQGGFIASSTNYVGLDLVRAPSDTTIDTLEFIDPNANVEFAAALPLASLFSYRILISSVPFSSQPQVCPVAIVVTDSANNVVSVEDARSLAYRLGSGGQSPSATYTYPWATIGGIRTENPITTTSATDPFAGTDKSITSMTDWMDATMTRLWELGGGERWYSPTTDKNVRVTYTDSALGSAQNFDFNGTQIRWSGVGLCFDNSTAISNVVADQLSYINLPNLSCLYVDVQRGTDGTTLTAAVGPLLTLGMSTTPGARYVLAWRIDDVAPRTPAARAYARNYTQYIGASVPAIPYASTTAGGKIYAINDTNTTNIVIATTNPVAATVLNDNTNTINYLSAIASGLTRGEIGAGLGAGAINIGRGAYDNKLVIGKFSPSNPGSSFTGTNNLTNDVRIYSRRILLNSGAAASSSLASTYPIEIDVEVAAQPQLLVGANNASALQVGGGGTTLVTAATTTQVTAGTTLLLGGSTGTTLTAAAGNTTITATSGNIVIAPLGGSAEVHIDANGPVVIGGTIAPTIVKAVAAQQIQLFTAATVAADIVIQNTGSKTGITPIVQIQNTGSTTVAQVDAAGSVYSGKDFKYITPQTTSAIVTAAEMVSMGTFFLPMAGAGTGNITTSLTNQAALQGWFANIVTADIDYGAPAWFLGSSSVLGISMRFRVPAGSVIPTNAFSLLLQSNSAASNAQAMYLVAFVDTYTSGTTGGALQYPVLGGAGFLRTYMTNTAPGNVPPRVHFSIADLNGTYPAPAFSDSNLTYWMDSTTGIQTIAGATVPATGESYVTLMLVRPGGGSTTQMRIFAARMLFTPQLVAPGV